MTRAWSIGRRRRASGRLILLVAIAGLTTGCVGGPASSGSWEDSARPFATQSSTPTAVASAASLGPTSAAVSPSVPATPTATLAPDVVPWVDRPAPAYVEPTPKPYPTGARPCQPADLAVTVGQSGAGLGNTNLPVQFVNRSGSTCVLNGYPTIGGLSSEGTLTSLAVGQGSYFGDPGPAANTPGEVAALNISGTENCPAAQSGQHRTYPTLRICLPGGGSVDVRVADLDTICGLSVSRFGVPADEVPVPNPSPSPLTALIDAPPTAAPGQTFEYTVTVTNASGTDYGLDPCPIYEEFVGSGTATLWIATVRDYYLNCDVATTIPAHGSVTFQMRLQLPADQPGGMVKFGWSIAGGAGPYAGAPLQVQGSGG